MTERWRPVVAYEECYAVSDQGRMARTSTYGSNPQPRWKILAPRRSKKTGYITYHLSKDGKKSTPLAHRLVWTAFKGPIPSHLEINHKKGIRHDNRLSQLELLTRSQNAAHSFRELGRANFNVPQIGSKNGCAKLTEADIPIIRQLAASGMFQYQIAKRFGVSQPAIGYVLLGKRWRHV